MKAALLAFAAALLAGCAATPAAPAGAISPLQAIALAAGAAPRPAHAVVALQVRSVGQQHGVVFLNSEDDYRDQRNVSLAIAPDAVPALEARFGGPLKQSAAGRRLRVEGAAQRVTVWLFDSDGKRTDKFYYQTHIPVVNAAQIELL